MSLESTYKDRPTALWVVILIVAAVGVWYLVQGVMVLGNDFSIAVEEELQEFADDIVDLVRTIVAGVVIVLGALTLIIAFLLYSGSKGGKTFLVVILIISILFNIFGLINGNVPGLIELVLAVVCLFLLYRPDIKAYFG